MENNNAKNYSSLNAEKVLERVNIMIDGNISSYQIRSIYKNLSIFDWYTERLTKAHLKKMRTFLKEAIALGYKGHVSFKVGDYGCANGMWAHKEESRDGQSPKGDFLYRSFTPDCNYWCANIGGVYYPSDEHFDECKTVKQLKNLIELEIIEKAKKIAIDFSKGTIESELEFFDDDTESYRWDFGDGYYMVVDKMIDEGIEQLSVYKRSIPEPIYTINMSLLKIDVIEWCKEDEDNYAFVLGENEELRNALLKANNDTYDTQEDDYHDSDDYYFNAYFHLINGKGSFGYILNDRNNDFKCVNDVVLDGMEEYTKMFKEIVRKGE